MQQSGRKGAGVERQEVRKRRKYVCCCCSSEGFSSGAAVTVNVRYPMKWWLDETTGVEQGCVWVMSSSVDSPGVVIIHFNCQTTHLTLFPGWSVFWCWTQDNVLSKNTYLEFFFWKEQKLLYQVFPVLRSTLIVGVRAAVVALIA